MKNYANFINNVVGYLPTNSHSSKQEKCDKTNKSTNSTNNENVVTYPFQNKKTAVADAEKPTPKTSQNSKNF